MRKPIATLSLDLDNKWAYLRTHGDKRWTAYPSYLPLVVPRVLDTLDAHDLRLTAFVVGQDAARAENREAIESLVAAGHEIGNHSQNHYPWLHTLPEEQIECEILDAEESLERVTGELPRGFRGPGFSWSPRMLELLARRGYLYDASTFPTFLGPAARVYCLLKSTLNKREREERKELFGSVRDGLRPLKPYLLETLADRIVEIPVTTMPLARVPFHMTYLLYLRQFSAALCKAYLRTALALCKLRGVAPSMLLHPLDFLDRNDVPELAFFPGMSLSRGQKAEVVQMTFEALCSAYRVVPLIEQAQDIRTQHGLSDPTIAAWQTESDTRIAVAAGR
jgi:hypothetical protein